MDKNHQQESVHAMGGFTAGTIKIFLPPSTATAKEHMYQDEKNYAQSNICCHKHGC